MRSEHVTAIALAAIAFLNAQAIAELAAAALAPDARELAQPGSPPSAIAAPSPSSRSARPILERNPFDHSTGSLVPRSQPARSPAVHPHGPSMAAAAEPDRSSAMRAKTTGEIRIERSLVDTMLADQSNLTRQARAVPVREDGRIVGVRLSGIRPDGVLARLGIQNGDEVRKVNGFEIGTPDKALEACVRLAKADRLSVELRRGGVTMILGYAIE